MRVLLSLLSVLFLSVASGVFAGSVATFGPRITAQTVPTLQWTLALNATDVPRAADGMAAQPDGGPTTTCVVVVSNQTLTYVDAVTGASTTSVQLPAPPTSTCFQPVGAASPSFFFVACTPNQVIAVQMGAIVWSRFLQSNVTLPATASFTPMWTSGPVLASAAGDDLLLVAGSGALFTLKQSTGLPARTQYGPIAAGVLPQQGAFVDMQVVSLDQSSPALVIAAYGAPDAKTSIVDAALFQLTVPASYGSAWQTDNIFNRGNATFPVTNFIATVVPATQRVYVSAVYLSGAKSGQAMEIFRYQYSAAPVAPTRYLAQLFASHPDRGVLESADGMYLMPKRIADQLPIMRVSDGTIVQNWPITSSNLSTLLQATLAIDGPNLYLSNSNYLAVLPFNPAASQLEEFVWSFSFYQSVSQANQFGAFLPAAIVQQVSFLSTASSGLMLVRTKFDVNSGQSSLDGTLNDRLWAFGSTVAGGCNTLPDADDNCGTCDEKTGVLTARNCAYCGASSKCTEYSFPGIAAVNQTCTDDGFPQSLSTCNGAPADKHVAIIVGTVVGGIVLLALAICYLAKRKPTPAPATEIHNEPNFSTAGQATGTYQSL